MSRLGRARPTVHARFALGHARFALGATLAAMVLGPALVAPAARAQATDVPALIKLVGEQPADMDPPTWKERRRLAARKLAASGDPRALPILMKVAESETFDIVGEIAIEGLGQLGDPQAIAVLQRIEADPSRDRGQRELAKKALAKLGGKAVTDGGTPTPDGPPAATPDPAGADQGDATATPGPGLGATLLGSGPAAAPAGPRFSDDLLAERERLTFALGNGSLAYDTVRERSSIDLDVQGAYDRRIERERVAWGYGGGVHLVAGYLRSPPSNPANPASTSRGAQLAVSGHGEARFYAGSGGGVYGVGLAEAGQQTTYLSVYHSDPNNPDRKDVRFATELQIALGVGYGRVLDVGGAVRVRRIGAVLEKNRALGRAIDDVIARKLQSAWWALRASRSTHPVLLATIGALREAGVLLGEPDAGLTYELLEVLRDGQLDRRDSGLDAYLAFGEGYLAREDTPPTDEGRVEQVLLRAAYARQLGGDTAEIGAEAYARQRLFAGAGVPAPAAAGLGAHWRRFVYGDHFDPIGALDLGLGLAISDDDLEQTRVGASIAGQVGWSFAPNRASWIRVGADAKVDAGELFVGATIEATYGLLAASFARL